jgi:carbon-monoxide dehydrogenase medium subunit
MRFEYIAPNTIKEAIAFLSKYDGKAKIIAGGTDLIVDMRNEETNPDFVVDIGNISNLDYIKFDERKGLKIGTLTTIRSLEKSTELQQRYPIIARAAGELGSMAIRNVATIGGNICNAVPSADTVPALIGLSAKLKIIGRDGQRVVPLENFFVGTGKTILKKGELLVEIQVPVPSPNTRGIYLKHSKKEKADLAIVGVAVVLTVEPEGNMCQDVRIVLGAAAPTVIRARRAEDILRGKHIDDALVEQAAQTASEEANPNPRSFRASPWYRREMVKVFTRRAIKEALEGWSWL